MTTEEDVFFADTIPNGIPGLSEADMAMYRQPHVDPASRLPMLTWVRGIPIGGEPADVGEVVGRYRQWLDTTSLPKLLLTVEPGAIIQAPTVDQAIRTWRTLTHVNLGPGGHFVPDEHGHVVAAHLTGWLQSH